MATDAMIQSQDVGPRWRRRFFAIWVGQAASLFGSSLVGFALIWWLTDTTRSATVLATATLVSMLPHIVLGPLAGALVDRWNRRRVMIVADSTIAISTAILLLLFMSEVAEPWHVFLILMVRSLCGSFHGTAMTASTPLMVPSQHLARVQGANQALQGLMNIVAPPVGALLLFILPIHLVLSIDVFTALLGVLPVAFFHIPQPKKSVTLGSDGKRTSVWADLRAGVAYVRAWPGMLMLIAMATLLNFLLNPAFSLLPLLVAEHFGGDASLLAAFNSAFGVAVLVGGIVLGVWGGFKRRMVTSLIGVAGIGVGALMIGIAPSDTPTLAIIGMSAAGFMMVFANGPLMAIMQTTVPPEIQGRVTSLLGAGTALASPLSLLVAGPISDAIGIQSWYVLAGLACIIMAVLASSSRAMMSLENGSQAQTPMASDAAHIMSEPAPIPATAETQTPVADALS